MAIEKVRAYFEQQGIGDRVREFTVSSATVELAAQALGCQPCTLSFGLGRTACEASSLSLEAMKDGRYDIQSEIEKRITDTVNATGIGPIGLGGSTSVLATFIKIGNMRASGFRVVSMRPNCCMEIRKSTCEWETV